MKPRARSLLAFICTLGMAYAITCAILLSCTSCASANEKMGDAALTGAAAAGGSAAGGPFLAGIAAGLVTLWNWLGGGSSADAATTLTIGQSVGVFIDRAILWLMIGGIALLATWLIFARSRAIIWDFVSGIPKALWHLLHGDAASATSAVANLAAAPLRLAGALGEPMSRRAAREIKRENSNIERRGDTPIRRSIKSKDR